VTNYSIKDLETLSGIKAHTIRIWEQRYEIVKPERTDTNIRLYDAEQLKKLLNISLLNRNGHKISKIAKMSQEELYDQVLEIERNSGNEEIYITGLIQAMVDTNEELFDKVISSTNTKYGFENTMINIIYPFLQRIGVLWLTGSINPAQEHFITNLIRQKTISAIDAIFVPRKDLGEKYLLFLPEGELHELSILFGYYMLKSRNKQVVYLGQSLPLNDLDVVYKIHKPEYVMSIFTSSPDTSDLQDYINFMSSQFKESKVILTGVQIENNSPSLPENIIYLKKVTDLIDFLSA
jgi:DNA-binding transcriptional MerR regulator